jgi:hypothetical protein
VRLLARRAGLAALVLLLSGLSGCVDLEAARIPDKLLEGPGGNGWEKNATASQAEPESSGSGTAKTQTLVYEDRRSREGYPGTLTVTSLRTLVAPSQDKVLSTVEARIREEAGRKGIAIQGAPSKGTRVLHDGAEASWFVYEGKVSTAGFFSRNADVKIFGEVSQCGKTVVAVVGLAQTTDVRSVGGVVLPSDPDPATWREMVADPRGTIEGVRGSNGLAYNVMC